MSLRAGPQPGVAIPKRFRKFRRLEELPTPVCAAFRNDRVYGLSHFGGALYSMSFVKYRLKEVAADFGVAPKEISEIISKFYEKPKSNTQVLTDPELNAVFDYMTQKNQIKSLEQVFAVKSTAPKASAPQQAAPQQSAPKAAAPQQGRPQQGGQNQRPQQNVQPARPQQQNQPQSQNRLLF